MESREIWRIVKVEQKTDTPRPTIYEWMREGLFPKSVKLGMAEQLLPQLGSIITPIRPGGYGSELDQYGASNDAFVRAMGAAPDEHSQ